MRLCRWYLIHIDWNQCLIDHGATDAYSPGTMSSLLWDSPKPKLIGNSIVFVYLRSLRIRCSIITGTPRFHCRYFETKISANLDETMCIMFT